MSRAPRPPAGIVRERFSQARSTRPASRLVAAEPFAGFGVVRGVESILRRHEDRVIVACEIPCSDSDCQLSGRRHVDVIYCRCARVMTERISTNQ